MLNIVDKVASLGDFERRIDVVKNTHLNPVHMSVKQWYRHLLETNVTMERVDDEGRMVAKKCKLEDLHPGLNYQLSYHLGRVKGLTPEVKSFNFKLIHMILPSKGRISQILPNSSPICTLCKADEP